MRWRSMLFAGAAVLAAVHVLEVLTATSLWRFAEVTALVLLAASAAVRGSARVSSPGSSTGSSRADTWWVGPLVLSPLVLDALLTIPPAEPRTFGWQVLTQSREVNPWVDAVDQAFRHSGPVLLFVLALLVTRPASERLRTGWRVVVAAVLGLAVAGYAAGRVALVGHGRPASSVTALVPAVVIPVLVALAALAFAAVGRGWTAVLGGVLIAAAALPMIDAMIGSVPTPYVRYAADGPGLFGWDAITPTSAFPAPVAAVEEALLLAGVLVVMAGARFRRSGGARLRRSGG